jgi:TonB family protein
MDYIAGKLGYPEDFQRKGIEKKVSVVFTVDQKGRIIDVKVERKDGTDIDAQTIRIIENGPKSDPADKTGNLKKMHVFVPLKFKSE